MTTTTQFPVALTRAADTTDAAPTHRLPFAGLLARLASSARGARR